VKKSKRIALLLLAAAFLAAAALSALYIAAETEHHCEGEHCRVCAQLSACRNTLRLLAQTMSVAVAALAAAGILRVAVLRPRRAGCALTPVLLKVKLSN